MTPPPIRYPLPTLILLIAGSLLVWKGEAASRPLRRTIAEMAQRAMAGPPVPASSSPQRLVGPVVRRVLLKTGDVPASDLPGGRPSKTVRLKQFLNVYDVWPLEGKPSHFRVGNRMPIGWIRAEDALEWSNRLVVRSGSSIRPVLSWTTPAIEVAIWDERASWEAITQIQSIPLKSEQIIWGIWASRAELLDLMGRTGRAISPLELEETRLRAMVGHLASSTTWSDHDREKVRQWLPPEVLKSSGLDGSEVLQGLARFNESWTDEVQWSGIGFSFIPLNLLP